MSDQTQQTQQPPQQPSRPNEQGSVYVQGFLKIYDPNSQRVYLESRA